MGVHKTGARPDCDCPAWLTCQGGLCAQCSTCPAGQRCIGVTLGGPGSCATSAACGLGGYCVGAHPGPDDSGTGICLPIHICVECAGGCQTCNSNTQCSPGEVCVGEACTMCTADSQCGPTAKCEATHTSEQCTCSKTTDCACGETCQSGICAPPGGSGCGLGPGSECDRGLACINGVCGQCTSFEDCNTDPYCSARTAPRPSLYQRPLRRMQVQQSVRRRAGLRGRYMRHLHIQRPVRTERPVQRRLLRLHDRRAVRLGTALRRRGLRRDVGPSADEVARILGFPSNPPQSSWLGEEDVAPIGASCRRINMGNAVGQWDEWDGRQQRLSSTTTSAKPNSRLNSTSYR